MGILAWVNSYLEDIQVQFRRAVWEKRVHHKVSWFGNLLECVAYIFWWCIYTRGYRVWISIYY